MLKGFREFIARGNVIDLATAVIIGAAFTAVVTAFTEHVVQPLISRIGATPDSDYGVLRIPLGDNIFIDFNAVLSAIINFLIVAAVIYFIIIVPYKKLKELDSKVEEEDDRADGAHRDSRPAAAGRYGGLRRQACQPPRTGAHRLHEPVTRTFD